MTPRQIPFELPVGSAESREDLIVGRSNTLAVELIDAWPDWPGRLVIVCGPEGSGKSHMTSIWARKAAAPVLAMESLVGEMPPPSSHIAIENAEPGRIDEKALFHLINHMRAEGFSCLITSRHLPGRWRVELPDLSSRLKAAQLVPIEAPDDEMLRMIIVKLFADRQLSPDNGVVDYLAARMERSLGAATKVVSEIDREALARGKKISRSVAAAALANLGMG